MKFILRLVLSVLVLLGGATAVPARQADGDGRRQTAGENSVRVEKNLPYRVADGLDPYETGRCKLDLYLPATAKDSPVVVWFYGGGLEAGSKDDEATVAAVRHLARSGIVVAVPDYRLFPRAKFPAYLDDAAAATAWVIREIHRFGGDGRQVFLAGHSAGAWLGYMLALDQGYLKKHGLSNRDLRGLVAISGQTFTHSTIRKERGVPDPGVTPVIDPDSPCYQARPDAPPILAICAGGDTPDRKAENLYLMALLDRLKHTGHRYLEVPDRDHMSLISKMPGPDDPVTMALTAFIRENVPAGVR